MTNDFIISLFPNSKEEDIIYAIPRLDKGKTDFIIKINGIDKINLIFNREDIIEKAIEHFIINGRYKDNVDVLVHGTIDDFFWIKKEEIFQIMLAKKRKLFNWNSFWSFVLPTLEKKPSI